MLGCVYKTIQKSDWILLKLLFHRNVIINTGLKLSVKVLLAWSCLILCNPIDSNLPDSSVHGIFQARVLEWVAISFSRGSSQPRDWTRVFRIAVRRFTICATLILVLSHKKTHWFRVRVERGILKIWTFISKKYF